MNHEMTKLDPFDKDRSPVRHGAFIGLRNALIVCLPFWVLIVAALIWWLA
jgi:hypothetical protein